MNELDPEKKISFEELCAEAQVSERTVRYYVYEGLLPPSEGSGRAAGYRRDHLLRLVAIRYLNKVLGKSLAEIKEELATISRHQLEVYYQQARNYPVSYTRDAESFTPDEDQPAGSSALEYLKSVRSSQNNPVARKPSALSRQPGGDSLSKQANPTPKDFYQSEEQELGNYATSSTSKLPGDSWQHVTLVPGVELHFTTLAPHDERFQKVMRLLQQARDIFNT